MIPSKDVSLAMNYKIVSTQLLTLAFCTALHFAIVVRTFSSFKLIDLYILSQKLYLSTKIESLINFTSKLLNVFSLYNTVSLYQNNSGFNWRLLTIRDRRCYISCLTESSVQQVNKKYGNGCLLQQEGSS